MGYACESCIEEKIKEAKLAMLDTDLDPQERIRRVSELVQEAQDLPLCYCRDDPSTNTKPIDSA